METGRHDQRLAIQCDKQHVRKAPQQSTANVSKDSGELQWIFRHPLYRGVDLGAEPAAQSKGFICISGLRVDQFRARRRSKYNGENYGEYRSNSAFNPDQLTPRPRSWPSEASRLASSVCCAELNGK